MIGNAKHILFIALWFSLITILKCHQRIHKDDFSKTILFGSLTSSLLIYCVHKINDVQMFPIFRWGVELMTD